MPASCEVHPIPAIKCYHSHVYIATLQYTANISTTIATTTYHRISPSPLPPPHNPLPHHPPPHHPHTTATTTAHFYLCQPRYTINMASSSLFRMCWLITGLLVAVTAMRGSSSDSPGIAQPAGASIPTVCFVAIVIAIMGAALRSSRSPFPPHHHHHYRQVHMVTMEPTPLHHHFQGPSRLLSDNW